MSSIVLGKKIPLTFLIPDELFLLISITPIREYADGKATDKVIGFKYEVVDTVNFDKIFVKIPGQPVPLMSNDELLELREKGEKVAVEFEDATVLPYWNWATKSVEDSFAATDVRLVKAE